MTTTATTITVSYERKFSDGNYGSEGLSLSMTVPLDQAESNDHVAIDEKFQVLQHDLRRLTLEALARSEADRVATMACRELNPPPPRQPAPAGVGTTADHLEEIPF